VLNYSSDPNGAHASIGNGAILASSTVFAPSFAETHTFGIFIPLANDIRADIYMNGNNLLAFQGLSMQVYLPLK
jgi:hypothetical protein